GATNSCALHVVSQGFEDADHLLEAVRRPLPLGLAVPVMQIGIIINPSSSAKDSNTLSGEIPALFRQPVDDVQPYTRYDIYHCPTSGNFLYLNGLRALHDVCSSEPP